MPLAVSGYLLAASPGGWCAPKRDPYINVRIEKWAPGIDLTRSSADLQHFKIDTVNPYGPGVESTVGGLTNSAIEVGQKIAVGGARLGASHCLWFERVDVTVVLKPTIFVAREYPQGSCRFKAIWDHELKHVAVDKALLDKYRGVYDRSIRDAVRAHVVEGPFINQTDRAVQDIMINRLQVLGQNITARMKSERDRLQQQIDTLAEYERVGKLCR